MEKEQENTVLGLQEGEGEYEPLRALIEPADHDHLSKGQIGGKYEGESPSKGETPSGVESPSEGGSRLVTSSPIESLPNQRSKARVSSINMDALLDKHDNQTKVDVTMIHLEDGEALMDASDTYSEMKPVSPIFDDSKVWLESWTP